MMMIQVSGYDGMFPKTLRELLDYHPKSGEKTTLKELAKYIGIRPQSVSLYKNGETQPTPETLLKIAEFFDVSVDYLLTGISSENKSIHTELGLSEQAIDLIKRAKVTDKHDSTTTVMATLNGLLSDRDFYEFLEDVTFKASQVKAVLNGAYDQDNIRDLNVEGYFIWDLQKYIEEFIFRQLVKNGLTIEGNAVKMYKAESYE